MDSCSLGNILGEQCHKRTYCATAALIRVDEMNSDERNLLALRSGIETVSQHHHKFFLVKYEEYQRVCCNPYAIHGPHRKGWFVSSLMCINGGFLLKYVLFTIIIMTYSKNSFEKIFG